MYRIYSKVDNSYNHGVYQDNDGQVISKHRNIICVQDNYIVQQCTGYKDLDGTLTYDGDNLNYNGSIATIKFKYGCFSLYLDDKWINTLDEFASCGDTIQYKIIGNIMEDNNDTT